MAQKSLKAQAARNTSKLNQTHLISLGINLLYILLRAAFFKRRLLPYLVLSAPSFIIEFWFERIGRPSYSEKPNGKDLVRAGEDLEAKGLTEWMWDVVYWTWGCTVLATFLGDWTWWLYTAVPLYSAYLAFTTYNGMRNGIGGLVGDQDAGKPPQSQSKRQAKLEKRGGQKVQYR